jgi:hypothetical protein
MLDMLFIWWVLLQYPEDIPVPGCDLVVPALLLSWFDCGNWGRTHLQKSKGISPGSAFSEPDPVKLATQSCGQMCVSHPPWRSSLTWSSLTIVLVTLVSLVLEEFSHFLQLHHT